MNSGYSDTESDVSSDSETETFALEAFKLMTDKLCAQKTRANSDAESFKSTLTSYHRQIYETFQEESAKQTIDKDCNTAGVNNGITFFIDKKPEADSSRMRKSDTEYMAEVGTDDLEPISQTPVEVTDLPNLELIDDGKSKHGISHNLLVQTSKNISKSRSVELSTHLKTRVDTRDTYVNVNPLKKYHVKKKAVCEHRPQELEVMEKCVITDEIEKQDVVSPFQSVRQKKKQRKLEREKTKGNKWFHIAAPEITEERKHDLEVLQMRKVLDPKRFYKSTDIKGTPKYFQFGRVVETAADFYHSRVPKKQRKSTMVEELLADAEFRQFNKRKYEEIQEMKRQGKGPYQRMKRLRKKKKQK